MIFISHNMYQVERICNRVMLLDSGKIIANGNPDDVIAKFYDLTSAKEQSDNPGITIYQSTGDINSLIYNTTDEHREKKESFKFGEDILINLQFNSKVKIEKPIIGFVISSTEGVDIGVLKNTNVKQSEIRVKEGANEITMILKNPMLLPGAYRTRFKFKTANNISLIEGGGVGFTVEADASMTAYDGIVKFEQEWI